MTPIGSSGHWVDPRFSAHCCDGTVHGMTVVTRNVANFKPKGVTIVNPWAPSP